jgi:hypothetical protein
MLLEKTAQIGDDLADAMDKRAAPMPVVAAI